jgi:hypothetical protein
MEDVILRITEAEEELQRKIDSWFPPSCGSDW